MLNIIDADKKYLEQYKEAYIETEKQIKLGSINKRNQLFLNPDKANVIEVFKNNRNQEKLPAHYVPSYDYFVVEGNKLIGIIHIRIKLTDNLLRYGGHIGYAVNPKYWNMGYGKKILELCLKEYKDLIQEDKILITCDVDNVGSYKIIEANGGILENIIENEENGEKFFTRRYWIKK